MEIKTELSIGDKVWILKDYKIVEAEVEEISMCIRPKSKESQWKREIHYGLNTGNGIDREVFEGTEGKWYFRTKQELIDYITKE